MEALDDMSYLEKLESVWGDIYFPEEADLAGSSLKIVAGNLHGESLTTVCGLEHLEFVGGTIFYQGQQFHSAEEFMKVFTKKELGSNKE